VLAPNGPWELLVDTAHPERVSEPYEGATYFVEDRAAALFATVVEPPQ
jgi:hypothetical protein